MNAVFSYLQDYFRNTDKWLLGFCICFAGILIVLNYRFGIETRWLYGLSQRYQRFFGFYGLYAVAFIIPAVLIAVVRHTAALHLPLFWIFLLFAPALFALKVAFTGTTAWMNSNDTWQRYFAIIADLPSRLFIVLIPLFALHKWLRSDDSFWGLTTQHFNWHPYALMLLVMVPLIAFASTQHDFLQMYPKVQRVSFVAGTVKTSWPYKLLYELCYGSDFFTIELFFRGLLVFLFVRYLGPDAILPMAVFYCSIHFGKPLFECISSFFGGMLLGIIAYRTQSIVGGLIVHLGIAWMMELGATIGNLLVRHGAK